MGNRLILRSILITCILSWVLIAISVANAKAQPDDPALTDLLTLQGEIRSDASWRVGGLQVSFPIWKGTLPLVGEVKTLGAIGLCADVGDETSDFSLNIDKVEVHAKSGRFDITLGRGNVRWGAGKYATLILDDRAPSYPFVQAKAVADTRFGKAEYCRLIGELGPQPDTYLMGQRLDLYPRSWLRLGVSEVAIADGRFVSMPTNWIPLWPFYLTQHLAIHSGMPGINEDSNENLGLDVTATLRPGTVVYGEFFVDDMPQRPENPGIYQIAFLVGGTTELKQNLRLDAEYARVNNYTYTFRNPARSYLNQGRPLGFQLGPDTDRLIVMLRRQFESIEVGTGFELRRRGEGRIGDKWQDIGWKEARKRSFLYGVVEETSLVRAEANWEIAPGSQIGGGISIGKVSNADNVAGTSEARVEWNFGLRYQRR